jgi:putative transposase
VTGGCYFFTVVTYSRRPFFEQPERVDLLREAFRWTQRQRPFCLEAIAILPDHLHCLWQLPEGDSDYSGRWRSLKQWVAHRVPATVNHRGEKAIWQRRFWEHWIRDEEDWRRHLDYIHYNPVKHGYVECPADWPYSSFRHAVERGWYASDWGRTKPDGIDAMELE